MDDYITYFRALVEEQEDVESWWTWWPNHQDQLKQSLSPGQFLRLKQSPLPTIYEILSEKGYDYPQRKNYVHPKFYQPFIVPTEWLTHQVSIEEVEKKLERDTVFSQTWELIKDRMEEGDECWAFRSPSEAWKQKMGRVGYAIVREGEPVDGIVTMLN